MNDADTPSSSIGCSSMKEEEGLTAQYTSHGSSFSAN